MSDLSEGPETKFSKGTGKNLIERGRKIAGSIDIEKVKQMALSKAAVMMMAACLIGVTLIGGSIYYYNCKNSGYAVSYHGNLLGYVRDMDAAKNALESVKERLKGYDSSIDINDNLEFKKVLIDSSKLTDGKNIVETIESGLYIQYTCYAVAINGSEVAVVRSEDEAKQVEEGISKYYEEEEAKTGAQVLGVDIKDEIKVDKKIVDSSKIVDVKAAIDKLIAGKGTTKKYEVQPGDTLWRISQNNNMGLDDVIAVNPDMDAERLQIGQSINLAVSEPYLNVETTAKKTADEDIPYDTKYVSDGNLYKGQSKVVESGEYGVNRVVREIKKLNGREIANTILTAAVVKSPVTQVLARGTKELVGSGRFMWPTGGSITSSFGSRGREFHKGLDIGAPVGSPIYAADSGTVIQSGRYYDYGLLVIIDHGNGYSTYYGHCSSLYVSEGETVKKGEKIAAVGMTGWTTGPHLHFEVRLNGSAQNPMRYLE